MPLPFLTGRRTVRPMPRALLAGLASLGLAATASLASADSFHLDPSSGVALDLGATPAVGSSPQAAETPPPTDAKLADSGSSRRWGRPGSFTLNFEASYADDFEDISMVPVAVGFSWFPIKSFSLDLQAEGNFVSQPGDNAAGGGLAFVMRWHFIDQETWSIYADLGVGFLVMSDDVPENAASFVFTPRAGLGFSYALSDSMRLMTGARWYHISNAQTADENPGINALQLYAGLSIGF